VSPRRVLTEDAGLRVTHDFEDTFLEWDGGEVWLCDHYGDPQCALVALEAGRCVVGGEGLDIFRLRRQRGGEVQIVGRRELWRRGSPPPDQARCWFVLELSWIADDLVMATAEVAGLRRTLEVDLRALAWREGASPPPNG
jgi:hypothetical protein